MIAGTIITVVGTWLVYRMIVWTNADLLPDGAGEDCANKCRVNKWRADEYLAHKYPGNKGLADNHRDKEYRMNDNELNYARLIISQADDTPPNDSPEHDKWLDELLADDVRLQEFLLADGPPNNLQECSDNCVTLLIPDRMCSTGAACALTPDREVHCDDPFLVLRHGVRDAPGPGLRGQLHLAGGSLCEQRLCRRRYQRKFW